MQRCVWVSSDPIYIKYHDNEWGKPHTDRQMLFELLCLEGQQAGLSWITVLKKRQNYRNVFHQFDPEKVALIGDADIERLLHDNGIIRNRGKLSAIISNARALVAMESAGEPFAKFIWSFVDNVPQINHYQNHRDIPAANELSESMSKALKKRGFKFIGATICYAFMQACGLINDHATYCFCHPDNHK